MEMPYFNHCMLSKRHNSGFFHAVLAHIGRAPVSKTGSGRFESCKRCHAAGGAYPAHDRILTENSVKN